MLGDQLLEPPQLLAARSRAEELGLESGLTLAVQEEPLLRCEAERALIPSGVGEDAELAEQLAHERGTWTGHGDVVCGPGVTGHGVLAAARVAPRLALHLE